MIRITIIADSVDELRRFLQQKVEESRPQTYKTIKDLGWPPGSYKPKHAKTGAVDGQLR